MSSLAIDDCHEAQEKANQDLVSSLQMTLAKDQKVALVVDDNALNQRRL
jgi:hypothetical protein